VRLVWSQLADRQVEEVLAWIVADDVAAARRWLEELLERVEALCRFPDAGRVVPELGRDEIRELLVGAYRVITAAERKRSRSLWSVIRRGSSMTPISHREWA
jgi:plasmid stabilization system protein ParE